ncbi:10866_t:CDS:2 [Dentiscutata erythropus]|uniref:10866_t:CDS:1 n=1 Tax=Dentiscutata erythropus TaxID=1348616 RepID=A0A9N9DRZ2_9GLOM|nr:10866_t:CDS:2 [Dentiscutata erythropus]
MKYRDFGISSFGAVIMEILSFLRFEPVIYSMKILVVICGNFRFSFAETDILLGIFIGAFVACLDVIR